MKIRHTFLLAALGTLPLAQAHEPQPATPATAQANRAVAAAYDLASPQDFEDAARGLVATLPGAVIRDAQGNVAWDGGQFAFIRGGRARQRQPQPVAPGTAQQPGRPVQGDRWHLADSRL